MEPSENSVSQNTESKKLLEKFREEMFQIKIKNQELFDQNLLKLSSAGLGVSIAFIKDIVQFIEHPWILVLSWAVFALAILVTLGSFGLGQHVAEKRVEFAENYYLGNDETALKKDNDYRPAKVLTWLNYISGGLFVLGIILTIVFCSLNLNDKTKGAGMAPDDKGKGSEQFMDGLSGGAIRPINQGHDTVQKGLQGVPIQRVNTQGNAGGAGTVTGQDNSGHLVHGGLTGLRMQKVTNTGTSTSQGNGSQSSSDNQGGGK